MSQRKHVRRRGLRRKQDTIPLGEIYLRDGGCCGICGGAVRSVFRAPHPKAATLDHIVPISRGGKHTRANVQIAHYGCNSSKGNRKGGQLRLEACS